MNVLMMNLSTFPWDSEKKEYRALTYNEFKYIDNESEIKVSGLYQLDPVVRLLEKKDVILDYIILFVTKKTRLAKKIVAEDYIDDSEISELDYFKIHLKDITQNDESRIIDIDIDEYEPANAISEAAKHLNKWCSEKETVNLYIDSHGGFRNTQLIEEAIIRLISPDRIKTTIYSVLFSGGQNQIVEDKAAYIFEFVSGINEFTNYGRIDSLLSYIDYEANKQLLDPIQEISEGIQWCNIPKFETGLRRLKNYYKRNNSTNDIYLNIFRDTIKNDYGNLLVDADIEPIYMLEWCKRKGFYQQTLTILESRMADTLFEKGVMSLTDEGRQYVESFGSDYVENVDILNGCLYCYKPTVGWWHRGNVGSFNDIFRDADKNSNYINYINRIKPILENKTGIDGDIYDNLLTSARNCSIRSGRGARRQNEAICFNSRITDEETYKKELAIFLFLHKTIKDIRNLSNHAADEVGYEADAILNALDLYMYLAVRLVARCQGGNNAANSGN